MMKRKYELAFSLLILCALNIMDVKASNYEQLTSIAPFAMDDIEEPMIPGRQCSVKDFGGVGDGRQLCTDAFRQAIESLSLKGGGQLIVPEGVWLTGPIVLKSHIDLHLERGAIILFAADDTLYPVIAQSYEGQDSYRCQSPISGKNLTDVAITGKGIIDGNGGYWRPVKRAKVTEGLWNELSEISGSVVLNDNFWMPSDNYRKGYQLDKSNALETFTTPQDWQSISRFLRPVMVSFVSCKRVKLEGVTFQNSPAWNIHPLMCENLTIDNIIVRNPEYAQNGDGLDIESCRNVVVTNSSFDTGDDAICLKSGKDAYGRLRARPSENIIIDGCKVFHGHGGIVIGSEMSGGVHNVLAQNCQFSGTLAGIRIKSCRGRGGVVSGITVRDITMNNIQGDAILADLYYGSKIEFKVNDKGERVNVTKAKPVDVTTPEFRDITIQNVTCHGAKRGIFVNGLPEMPIRHITLSDINITADKGAEYYFCEDLKLERVHVSQPRSQI